MKSRRNRIMLLLVVAIGSASGTQAPAQTTDELPPDPPFHLERPDDARLPPPEQQPLTVRSESVVTLGPYVSVQVNVDSGGNNIVGDAANEPSMAIAPNNSNLVAIGWRQFDNVASNFRQAGRAHSPDGGATWTFPGVLTPGTFRSDPVLEPDAGGTFFYNSLKSNFAIDVFKSTDGGATWGSPVPAFGGDKAWMAIDRTNGIGAGHIYFSWSTAAGCCGSNIFTRSTDAGISWMTPITIPNTPVFGTMEVAPDGALFICGVNQPSFNNSTFVVAKSTNAQNAAATPTFSTVFVNMGGAIRGATGPNPAGLLGRSARQRSARRDVHPFYGRRADLERAHPRQRRSSRCECLAVVRHDGRVARWPNRRDLE